MSSRGIDRAIIFHGCFERPTCPHFITVCWLSTCDDLSFSLLIGGFCLFEDIDEVLAGTDCLARFVNNSYRLDESCHVGELLL